jgi:hypothetical protein
MFDDLVRWDEHFKKGEYFTLVGARIGNEIETDFGTGRPAMLKIRTEDGDQWFSVFGQALNSQIERMESGELDRGVEVCIIDKANRQGSQDYKILATRQQVEADEVPAA